MSTPMSHEQITAYYTRAILESEVSQELTRPFIQCRRNLHKRDLDFLLSLKPYVDMHTDDSKSILLHVLETEASQEDILLALRTQPPLPGFSYANTAVLLESLKFYRYRGVVDHRIKGTLTPQQLLALHHALYALRLAFPAERGENSRGDYSKPLYTDEYFLGKHLVYYVYDDELLSLILDYADNIDAFVTLMTSLAVEGYNDQFTSTLRLALEGGAIPLTKGAL